MTDRINQVIDHPEIETVVEAMGGLEPAHTYLRQALLNHKNVITANKALVNAFGEELNQLAIQNKVSFLFSAACGGGIPFLPTLVEAMKASSVSAVGGILNGTTNFIIDKMERDHLPFEAALKQAQDLGYAEADPTGDLNGTDTTYKLRLALAVAMKRWVDLDSIDVAGIRTLDACDIAIFKQRQWLIRLLCFGKTGYGRTIAYVEPTLVEQTSDFASIQQNNNLAWFISNGQKTVLTGQGAGSIPTATNILRDLKAVTQKTTHFLSEKMTSDQADNSHVSHSYYVRHDKAIHSDFLNLNAVESWEDDRFRYLITTLIPVHQMHTAMKLLQQSGQVFYAGIALGGDHESL